MQIYFDNIAYTPTFKEHLRRLEQVLSRLQSHGLKVRPQKCHLFCKQIDYLGHVVSSEAVRPAREKVAAVQEWPTPMTVKDVQAFLSLTGYYRRFMKNFAHLANPLLKLLKGVPAGSKNRTIQWGSSQEEASRTLKMALTEAPILAYADFLQPFILHVVEYVYVWMYDQQ
ncbi:uncharacterized protein LOC143804086 [Ranitomeya variabilis]|uniref:uncharacterized protein LOC143804086 n=1 Tax=Ranitomeya variabilis TaxID=490064 RepID=UPI0040572854